MSPRRLGGVGLVVVAAACTLVGTPQTVGGPAGPAPERGGDPGARARPTFTPVRTFPEVRGLWVVRYTMMSRASIRTMVERAAEGGFNTLIVQVRGRGDALYQSRLEPFSEGASGPGGFDPLALAIEEAHARGMAVHAWINTHIVWDSGDLPVSRDHIVHAHPDWLAVPRSLGKRLHDVPPSDARYVAALMTNAADNLDSVEGIFTSPSNPAVQDRVYAVFMDLVDHYDLDGVHFDYIRYPGRDYDYSAAALARFARWVSPRLSADRRAALVAAERQDPYAFADALPAEFDDFRRAQIDQLVRRVYRGVKERRPEVVVSAAVVADAMGAYRSRLQNWRAWLTDGVLDVAVPMAYTDDGTIFAEEVHAARAAARAPERVWAGVGAYKNTFEGTLDKIDLARREGAGGVVLFSYDWAVSQDAPDGEAPFLERVGRAKFGRQPAP